MGLFNTPVSKAAMANLQAKVQEKKAMQTAVRSNPNATAKDYLQAGMSSFGMLASKAKAAKAAQISNQMQSGALGQSGMGRMLNNAMAARGATPINPTQPTAINPQAFTNQGTIGGVFGQPNQGTFTRTVGTGPLAQMVDPGYDSISMDQSQITTDPLTGRTIDPTMDQSAYAPVPPPTGVETNITPNYELNTQ